jgi:hypothetical protein
LLLLLARFHQRLVATLSSALHLTCQVLHGRPDFDRIEWGVSAPKTSGKKPFPGFPITDVRTIQSNIPDFALNIRNQARGSQALAKAAIDLAATSCVIMLNQRQRQQRPST